MCIDLICIVRFSLQKDLLVCIFFLYTLLNLISVGKKKQNILDINFERSFCCCFSTNTRIIFIYLLGKSAVDTSVNLKKISYRLIFFL